jgi:hypothetical protein
MDFQEIVNNAYFAASKQNKWTSSVETREAFNVAFQRGAQWSARTSSQLAPHIADFCEFMVWLTAIDLPSEEPLHEDQPQTSTER